MRWYILGSKVVAFMIIEQAFSQNYPKEHWVWHGHGPEFIFGVQSLCIMTIPRLIARKEPRRHRTRLCQKDALIQINEKSMEIN